MVIDVSHLRIMIALQEKGTLTEAAEALFLSQSALSHQIRHLESKLNIKLWQRCGRRLRLTAAGELLLNTAQQVAPQLQQAEQQLRAMAEGQLGTLRIGVECYPCFEWLNEVVADFLVQQPNIDIDIFRQFQLTGEEALLKHHIELLISPELVKHEALLHQPLFEYEQVLVVSNQHSLSKQACILPAQLQDQLLITFPIEELRLDIFKHFLQPASIQPKRHKRVESLALILQMVKQNRGVAVLPIWLAEKYQQEYQFSCCRLGKQGLFNCLYAVYKKQDESIAYLQEFIGLANTQHNQHLLC